jgi:hypothetical protein
MRHITAVLPALLSQRIARIRFFPLLDITTTLHSYLSLPFAD